MLPAVCTKKVKEIPDDASCVHKEGRRNNISMTLSKKNREKFLEISDEIYSLISLVASIFRMEGLLFSGSLYRSSFRRNDMLLLHELSNFNHCSFPFSLGRRHCSYLCKNAQILLTLSAAILLDSIQFPS